MSTGLSAPAPVHTKVEHHGAMQFDVADTRALVKSNVAINADYFQVIMQADGLVMTARAGQFFNIACPATAHDMPYLRRPMSIYRVTPAKRQIEFLYKVTGAGTRGLATLRAGDTVSILGPLGNGFTLNRSEEHTSELQSLRHLVC